jgi:hypothetical protein
MERPRLLKRKQTVKGEYTEEVGHKLKAESLWDSDVMATIEVTYDVRGTTATPRDHVYLSWTPRRSSRAVGASSSRTARFSLNRVTQLRSRATPHPRPDSARAPCPL